MAAPGMNLGILIIIIAFTSSRPKKTKAALISILLYLHYIATPYMHV